MCPDSQLLSIYVDGELPSPWKEKMESHLTECPSCREKFENFKRLQELFKKDTHTRRTFVENAAKKPAEQTFMEQELMDAAKEKVWRNLESRQRFRSDRLVNHGGQVRGYDLWRRRLSIPLPAAAAAAIIIALLAALWLRGGSAVQSSEPTARANFILASEEEIPSIIPAADMNGVLQYLGSDGADIIIMRLPESRSFLRSGEPEIINAAGYTRRRP